ncbi:hypothetical protein IFM89_035595 [Coptis chinensis]|uniref:Uncharacterized protein n=1 Tax=Coptis chinensis TaxID=261450 RepID=A0A835HZV0_9MAGN|nr:hypothetical protein IFM89_035595 [Coptis chinensis]
MGGTTIVMFIRWGVKYGGPMDVAKIRSGHDTSGLRRRFMIVVGDLAGALFWLMVYPTDFVKSVIQVDNYKNPKFSGSLDAFKRIKRWEGLPVQ